MTPAAVILTVAAYLAALFAVAWYSGRRAGNAGFFTGGRRTPWWMAALAMIGAAMSGVTFISVPGSVAADAFSYMQMVAGFTVGQLIVAFVLIPTFYRLRVVSLYEYLDNRFGVKSHRTGAWFFFISKMLGAALRVYVGCAVMQLLVFSHYGFPFWGNALVTMFFVWLYTRQGGVKSLIWTDTLKTLCLVAGLVLSIFFIARALGLSAGRTVDAVAASPFSRIFFFDDPSSDRYFWKMFFAGIFAGGVLFSVGGLASEGSPSALYATCVAAAVVCAWMQIRVNYQIYPFEPVIETGLDDETRAHLEYEGQRKTLWQRAIACERYGLSPREREILQILLKGRDAKYITDTFYISQSTAKTHIYNIYRKFGIHSRQELLDFIEDIEVPADEEASGGLSEQVSASSAL